MKHSLFFLLLLSSVFAVRGNAIPVFWNSKGCKAVDKNGAGAERGYRTKTRIDVNRASLSALCTLPGIGPSKARAIISFRTNRRIERMTQLLLVDGIGKGTLTRIRDDIYITKE